MDRYSHIISLPKIDEYYGSDFKYANSPYIIRKWDKEKIIDWDYLKIFYGEKKVVAYRTFNRNDSRIFTIREYIEYTTRNTNDTRPYYILDWFIEKNCPEVIYNYEVPFLFKSWLDYIPNFIRPYFLAFYIGAKNSASPLHLDIMGTSAWNTVFTGRKLWVFYPYNQSNLVYNGKINPFEPDYRTYPLFKKAQGFYCLQEEGDLVYTPSGWWHAVLNIEPSISITDNFINGSNIGFVFKNLVPILKQLIQRTWDRRSQASN